MARIQTKELCRLVWYRLTLTFPLSRENWIAGSEFDDGWRSHPQVTPSHTCSGDIIKFSSFVIGRWGVSYRESCFLLFFHLPLCVCMHVALSLLLLCMGSKDSAIQTIPSWDQWPPVNTPQKPDLGPQMKALHARVLKIPLPMKGQGCNLFTGTQVLSPLS